MYSDADYLVWMATLEVVSNTVPGLQPFAHIPSDLLFRSTTEARRREIGQGLHTLLETVDGDLLNNNTVTISVPDLSLRFVDLVDVNATDLHVQYTRQPIESLVIQGNVEIPQLFNATANFSGQNYLKLQQGKWSVVGSMSLSDMEMPSDLARIDSARIWFDNSTAVRAEAVVSAGPVLDLQLPSWAGGHRVGPVASIKSRGFIDEFAVWGSGSLALAGGLVEGYGEVRVDYDADEIIMEGGFDLLNGLISTTGTLRVNSQHDVFLSGAATFTFPSVMPLLGGVQTTGGCAVRYTDNLNPFDDYVKVWTTILGGPRIGFRLGFDGTFSVLGAAELADETDLFSSGLLASTDIVTDSFVVEPNTANVLVGAVWGTPRANVSMVIRDPDGLELPVTSGGTYAAVPSLTNALRSAAVISQPKAGLWTMELIGVDGVSSVSSHVFAIDLRPSAGKPVIVIDEATGIASVSVGVSGEDSSLVTIYRDDDKEGIDGVPLYQATASGGMATFAWDISMLPAGEYFIYATAERDDGVPYTSSYSNTSVGGSELITWGSDKVSFVDDDGSATVVQFVGDRWFQSVAFAGINLKQTVDGSSVNITGSHIRIESIISGSGATEIKVTSTGGTNTLVDVGSILVQGYYVNRISAPTTRIRERIAGFGDYPHLHLSSLDVHSLLPGALLDLNQISTAKKKSIHLSFDRIDAGATIVSDFPIARIDIKKSMHGSILAPSVGTFVIGGDFSGSVALLSAATSELALGNFRVNGEASGAIEATYGIGVINVRDWQGGQINASWIRSFSSKGDVNCSLELHGETKGNSLGTVLIGGNLVSVGLPGRLGWFVPNKLSKLTVRGDVFGFDLHVDEIGSMVIGSTDSSDIDCVGAIGAISAKEWNGGRVRAESIKSFKVLGDKKLGRAGDLTATIELTGASDPVATRTLGTLRVAGSIRDLSLRARGSIGTITAGEVVDSSIFVGVLPEFTFGVVDPVFDVTGHSTIGKLTVKGRVGETSASFSRTSIAARSIGTINCGYLDRMNNAQIFGVICENIVSLTYVREDKTKVVIKPGPLPGSVQMDEDFALIAV